MRVNVCRNMSPLTNKIIEFLIYCVMALICESYNKQTIGNLEKLTISFFCVCFFCKCIVKTQNRLTRMKLNDLKIELKIWIDECENSLLKMLNVNLEELWIYLNVFLCEFAKQYKLIIAGAIENHRHIFEKSINEIVNSISVNQILKKVTYFFFFVCCFCDLLIV